MPLFSIFRKTINIDCYYSYRDEKLREKLEQQLSSLKQENRIDIRWHKCQSVTGKNWKHENYGLSNTNYLIILMVSPEFMDLDDGWDIGRRAMKLHNARKARVIPVKLRPTHWEATPFSNLQYLPSNGEPVDNRRIWTNQNYAFDDIAQGIRVAVEDMEQEQKQRQLTRKEQQEKIFALISSCISSPFFQKIIQHPNIYTRSVPIVAGVLVVAFLGFYNFSQKNQAERFFNQGEQKSNERDFVGAVKDYTQAIQTDPNYIDAYIGRGNAHSYLKNYKAAIEDYTQVTHIDPSLADAYINLAVVRCKLKDKQGAIKDDQHAATLYAKQGAKIQYKDALDRLKTYQGGKSCSSN